MKRAALILGILGLAAIGAGVAYQSVAGQDQDYYQLLRSGDQALRSDQAFQAIEAYSNAVYLRPDSMLAHLRRGEAYQRRGDVDAAARDFQAASTLDPAAPRPFEALGDLRFGQGRFARAAEMYERLLTLDDHWPGAIRKLALSRYRDGNVDGALEALDQMARISTREADDYYLLGLCLRERAQLPDAAKAFERTVTLAPALTAPREELADVYATLGRRADHIDQLQALAGLDPESAERQVALGLAYARAGAVDVAVETLRTALDRTSDRSQIYAAIGRVWLESSQGRNDPTAVKKAVEALEGVASSATASSELLVLYGRALLWDGQLEDAERVLQQASSRFPVDPAAFVEYANAAERRGHFVEARTALVQYGGLTTNDRAMAVRAARVGALSLKLNEPAVAVVWLRQARVTLPDDTSVLTPLAEALLRNGNRVEARSTALHGLKLDPMSIPFRTVEIRTRE